MSLVSGSSKKAVGKNISELRHSGYPQRQAIAIAMSKAGKSRSKGRSTSRSSRGSSRGGSRR